MTWPWNWSIEVGMMDRLLWIAALCLSASTVAAAIAQAQEGTSRFAITAQEVEGAMQSRQLPTEDARIEIAAPITALSEHPHLEVQSMQLVGSRKLRLRMACRNRGECLSFFATVTYPESLNPAVIETKPEVAAPKMPALRVDRQSQDVVREPVLRSGAQVLLEMDGERVHILLRVICLEGGSAGDRIRVTTRDHKQSYVAQIVDPTLVKGSL